MDLNWACFLVKWDCQRKNIMEKGMEEEIIGHVGVGMGYGMQFKAAGAENVGNEMGDWIVGRLKHRGLDTMLKLFIF